MSVYTIYIEKEQSKGRVDCVIETPQFVYIFEFKLDGTAAGALQQIDAKAMRASTRRTCDRFIKLA